MKNEQLLSAFSYVSILFCPFIVPLVVYFAQANEFVRFHAKRALIGQSLVLASVLIFAVVFFISIAGGLAEDATNLFIFATFAISALLAAAVSIWSIIMTVLVFR